MLTFGEHKGSAIAIMTTLLSVVTASAADDIADGASVFGFAIDPNAFGRGDETRAVIQHQLTRVRSAAPAERGQRRAGSRRLRTAIPRRTGRRAVADSGADVGGIPAGGGSGGSFTGGDQGAGPGVGVIGAGMRWFGRCG